MINILILEKKHDIKKQIEKALAGIGYKVHFVSSINDALDYLSTNKVHMILASFKLNSCELCKELRSDNDTTPLITLIHSPSPKEKRIIFRSMADGYLETPFDSEELIMRVQNLFWRCKIEDSTDIQYGNATLHSNTFTLETGKHIIELRKMEFLLLEKLLSYPGRIFTRRQLMDELWGFDCESDPRTVDTHIRLLRKKLKKIESIRIQTIRGIGYRAAVPKK